MRTLFFDVFIFFVCIFNAADSLSKNLFPQYPSEIKEENSFIKIKYDYMLDLYKRINEKQINEYFFDCEEPKNEAETYICSNDELKQMETAVHLMTEAFYSGDSPVAQRRIPVKDDKKWLNARNNFECALVKSDKISCLKSLYKKRIQMLHNRFLGYFFGSAVRHEYFRYFTDLAISQGADINGSGYWNDPCPAYLHYGPYSYDSSADLYQYMIEHGARLEKSYPGCLFGGMMRYSFSPKTVQFLLDLGADINTVDSDNTNLLFNLYLDSQFLLERGANPNIQRKSDKSTPLMDTANVYGSYKWAYEKIKTYIDYGADVSLKNDSGDTALDIYVHAVKNRPPKTEEDTEYVKKTIKLLTPCHERNEQ